jgi:hypothetical protein
MNHLTTYRTTGWPSDVPDPGRHHRPAPTPGRSRLRRRLALTMRRAIWSGTMPP